MDHIRFFKELDRDSIPTAGGKGANLGAMARAGLPVPPGFVITTEAYNTFVTENNLQALIADCCARLDPQNPVALEAASEAIRAGFAAGKIPAQLIPMIRAAYAQICEDASRPNQPVAVRSSATAEDLPDMSFAGQQDTLLNITGEEALLESVIHVWGSLWTARAIGYRARNGIPQESVSLAVVVQQMVQSEVSGVLFTANPLTGKRSETVIDATLGLGEALVSGLVEPDQYVVEVDQNRIVRKTIGAKALSIRSVNAGGVEHREEAASHQQALPDEQILALASLGKRVAAHFGSPQDIEWAVSDEVMWLVQSRPITSLFPIPARFTGNGPLNAMFSFGSVQGMLDPLTPLGMDIFLHLAASIGRAYGLNLTPATQTGLLSAGERLWINVTNLMRYPAGRSFLDYTFSVIDPVFRDALLPIMNDPRLPPMAGPVKLKTRYHILKILLPAGFFVLRALIAPAAMRRWLDRYIQRTTEHVRQLASKDSNIADRAARLETMLIEGAYQMLLTLVPTVAAGQAVFQPLVRMASPLPGGRETALEMTRGLPHNVTTEMDLSLWDTAFVIRNDPDSLAAFRNTSPCDLAARCLEKALPPAAQTAVDRFLAQYGMRGLAEIDLGRIRWQDDPTPLMQALQSYLDIPEEASPRAVFERGSIQAAAARDRLLAMLRKTRMGWLKTRLAGFAAGRMRELTGLRESPKFTIIRILWQWRNAFRKDGQDLAKRGILEQPDDVFFLRIGELKALSDSSQTDFQALVAERRQTYEREKRRRQIPRLLLSDGTAVYESAAASADAGGNVLTGSPVSPGVVEGVVQVVYDPHHARLEHGEILVCPGTDPSWTPLFLAAGGLVMEVGGMMTHGAVVAREYGIPAVVSVTQATTRLKTGQRVRVDGSRGEVSILEEPA